MNRSPWANPVQWWRPVVPLPQARRKGVVTWESAQPILDAVRNPLPRFFANCYVLGVDGIPSGGHSAGYLRRFAVLRSTGRVKWSVAAATGHEIIRTSSIFAFGFRKDSAPIDPAGDDVIFEMHLGPWTTQTKFKPREMLYRGHSAL